MILISCKGKMKSGLLFALLSSLLIAQLNPANDRKKAVQLIAKAPAVVPKANKPRDKIAPVAKAVRTQPRPVDRAHGRPPVQEVRRRLPQQQRASPGRHDRALRAQGGRNPRHRRGSAVQKRPIMREDVEEEETDDDDDGSGSFFVPFPYYLPYSRIIVDSGRGKQEIIDDSSDELDRVEGEEEDDEDWFMPKEQDRQAQKKIILAKTPILCMKK